MLSSLRRLVCAEPMIWFGLVVPQCSRGLTFGPLQPIKPITKEVYEILHVSAKISADGRET